MTALQKIDRVRRDYNQWVANQTLEDFALRFTAKKARRFSAARVGQTAMGAVSFLALEAISSSITLHYGFTNTIAAIIVAAVIVFAIGIPICIYAAEYGVDIDLLTRGAGFGYIGSTITSLIYASFTFILFAIESAIMALALELCLGIPLSIGYLISALAVIPLVIYGITAISRFQVWTQPIWIALNFIPVIAIAVKFPGSLGDWRTFAGSESGSAGFQLVYFGAAISVVLAFVVQLGEQVDYLRFLPPRGKANISWWLSLLSAGPGWIVIGVLKLLAGSFLAVYLIGQGVAQSQIDPPHMYASAFQGLVGSPRLALAITCLFVVICQLKINITNAYAGSIAWSNFFSRLTHSHPGRVVWLVFNVILALLVMELGVYAALEQTLAFYSNVAIAWIGAIVADLVINKPLGLSPKGIEFKRAHLYDINPVGIGAMALAAVGAIAAQADLFGPILKALSPFLSLVIALVMSPAIAFATGGRFYLARAPETLQHGFESVTCCVCENAFEPEDIAHCPAYGGRICSLCCSLDARCRDMCKPHGRLHQQVEDLANWCLPRKIRVPASAIDFGIVALMSLALVGAVLALVGLAVSSDPTISFEALKGTLWRVFLLISIVAGVVGWLFILMKGSGRAALDETQRQTRLLMDEIESHQRTDLELKRAKEAAEAANFAKSRYVVGLSHELRTPLNSIMGYAQLLERDEELPAKSRGRVAVVKRSAHHLASLIDGLLDISKIEAGKLDLSRDKIAVRTFLGQLVEMFTIQAESKGISFTADISPDLPDIARADEKRVRQVLINLLSNAIKFTRMGSVSLKVGYRNEVAQFVVEDTGPGIAGTDLDRIFLPFERLRASAAEPGTGLGLTICRLLAGVMGGEIRVESELGVGSRFLFRLFLPKVSGSAQAPRPLAIVEPFGIGRKVLLADDDPVHRSMIADALVPFGFSITAVEDGVGAVDLSRTLRPDLYLLDIEMPGLDGWKVAEAIRATEQRPSKIVILSASAMEEHRSALASTLHDAFVMKPVDLDILIGTMATLLGASQGQTASDTSSPKSISTAVRIDSGLLDALLQDAEIGYIRGLRDRLTAIDDADLKPLADSLLKLVEAMDMPAVIAALHRLRTM